jgi:methyl-accepting chemotaxis protein
MRKFSIATRLYMLVCLAIAIFAGVMTTALNYSFSELEAERKAGLAQMDATAIAIFKKYHALETSGTMKREDAQKAAADVISAMRYGDSGYFWINDMHPTMVMHPIKPELNGKDLSQNKDPNGKFLFVEFVNTVKKGGEGFVDYYWPKPGADAPVLKYSHVVGFEPWGWIVGTGVYADDLAALYWQNAMWAAIATVVGALVIIGIAFAIVRSVVGPLGRVKAQMAAVAEEQSDVEISDQVFGDEAGEMAKALIVLRDSVEERRQMRGREASQQQAIESERRQREDSARETTEQQDSAIRALGQGLEKLAGGDLTVSLGDIGGNYAKLRDDFNAAATSLHDVIQAIAGSSTVVNESADSIGEATDMLSRRTEQQAASLEETAAALAEITSTVQNAADRATEASRMVEETKSSAGRSGAIVRDAVTAMGRIEESSSRIGQIISVIDEIAFQTNLLALNAGVEAARAGEAGRGFAVVAQEVRELAQRSATAAREIKTLIQNSASEVSSGVSLVRSTGEALVEIEGLVNQVNDQVAQITSAAREQATGLHEINTSVNEMDQMTQKNAAMVEETSAASQTLVSESDHLRSLLRKFSFRSAGEGRQGYSRAA